MDSEQDAIPPSPGSIPPPPEPHIVPHLDRDHGKTEARGLLRVYHRGSAASEELTDQNRMSSRRDIADVCQVCVDQDIAERVAFAERIELIRVCERSSVCHFPIPAEAEDPDMWTNEEVSNWFLCGEMQPAAVHISELLVAGPGLETDMEALCHQQETLQGFLDGAAAEGHWYEERDAADRLDAVERQIADRISASVPVTDDWGTLGNRLQKWAEQITAYRANHRNSQSGCSVSIV